jgi:hypothetical protein
VTPSQRFMAICYLAGGVLGVFLSLVYTVPARATILAAIAAVLCGAIGFLTARIGRRP